MRHPIRLFSIPLIVLLSACLPPAGTSTVPSRVPTSQATDTFTPPAPEPTATPAAFVSLHRGVNMGNMLEAPNEGEWGLTVQEEYFDLISDAGFDFVRLPVRWNAHAGTEWPYTVDPAFFARIDEVVGWAMERGLVIIVDFHHYEEMAWDPWSHKDRFLGIWKQVAGHYKDYPSSVLLELLNEPNDQLNAALWNEYLAEALQIVRETNPTRDVVIGPVQWNAYDWISTLDVPDDEHLIVTFHYYLPFEFTHQGAEWIGDESNQWLGRTWDATDDQKAEIANNFDSVADWSQRHGNIRILLGEFGAYFRADMESRLRWTEFVRSEAERHGFAWSYWEFGSGFGVYDPDAKVWREELLRALIP